MQEQLAHSPLPPAPLVARDTNRLPLNATLHGAPPTAGLSPAERLARLKGGA